MKKLLHIPTGKFCKFLLHGAFVEDINFLDSTTPFSYTNYKGIKLSSTNIIYEITTYKNIWNAFYGYNNIPLPATEEEFEIVEV